MTRQVSLDISDKNYEELISLSRFYNQRIEKTIADILEAVGFDCKYLENLKKTYKIPAKLRMVLAHFFGASTYSMSFFNSFLEKLEVKGLFVLQDFEYDLEECDMSFSYAALQGSRLPFESLCFTVEPGTKSLRVESIIEVEKVDKQSLERLKQAVEHFEEPAEFMDLEGFNVEVEDDFPEFATLVINLGAESIDDFPKARILSRVIKKLYKSAGITQ
jgi:hypothetical protein